MHSFCIADSWTRQSNTLFVKVAFLGQAHIRHYTWKIPRSGSESTANKSMPKRCPIKCADWFQCVLLDIETHRCVRKARALQLRLSGFEFDSVHRAALNFRLHKPPKWWARYNKLARCTTSTYDSGSRMISRWKTGLQKSRLQVSRSKRLQWDLWCCSQMQTNQLHLPGAQLLNGSPTKLGNHFVAHWSQFLEHEVPALPTTCRIHISHGSYW